VIALELAESRFYHIDTALCALPGGEVMYFLGAFMASARAKIRDRVAPSHRIELTVEDACRLSANAVAIEKHSCGLTLQSIPTRENSGAWLSSAGESAALISAKRWCGFLPDPPTGRAISHDVPRRQ